MTEAFWLFVLVLTALGALAVGYALLGRRRFEREELRRRFGPEYQRAVEETGSGKAARRELRRRLRRVARLDLRDLTPDERARFAAAWTDIQARFVDDPGRAVAASKRLVDDVMTARGYPDEGFEQRLADLSVRSPQAVQHARSAHACSKNTASTEELRRAMVHYRALLEELLAADERESPPSVEMGRETIV
jgi:hypothetical protein